MGQKLYTKCVLCKGDDAARQLGETCSMCEGEGYMDAGIHTGQVDQMMTDLRSAVFPGWQSYEEWVMRGRKNPKSETEDNGNE